MRISDWSSDVCSSDLIGAVVAQAWSDGAADAFAVPTLAEWKETTGMPWFGFWARELLRWGTHDPFVAFALSQGLAQTREAAAGRRKEFEPRSEERRVGKEGVSTSRSRWSP